MIACLVVMKAYRHSEKKKLHDHVFILAAMKLPDSEPLEDGEYLLIADPWRQEWERGVQVPVNPDHVPEVFIQQVYDDSFKGSFKLNPRKYLHATQDANFQSGIHELTMVDQMAEQVCEYGR